MTGATNALPLIEARGISKHFASIEVLRDVDLDLQRGMKGGPMTAWVNDRPSKLAVMPRNGTAADIRWFEHDPRHMFHELNMWEEDGKIVADVATANGTALFPDQDGNKLTHAQARQNLRRWTIDLAANTNTIKEEVLNDRDIQFPRPDDRFVTHRSRQSFANINLHSADGRIDGMDSVIRFDTQTGAEDIHHFGDGSAAGELIFAPRVGAQGEGDGYAMTLVHRGGAATSELAIFEASAIADGPIARVMIPFRVPNGFHCNFYPADGDTYQRTALAA